MHIETLLAQTGCVDDPETGSLIAPLHFSTTFHRNPDGSYPRGFVYGRDNNPTRSLLEQSLAQTENGNACAAFSSGMAAISAIFMSLKPGDHVLLPDDVYHGVSQVASDLFSTWNLEFSSVDMTDVEAIKSYIRDTTRLIWIETPSNPLLKVTDIQHLSAIAHTHGINTVVDNTWPTPFLQTPLNLGADLVVHSVTKYLAGHSDVLGGAIISNEDNSIFQRVKAIQKSCGAVMDPFSAWLTMRGMRSLSARIHTQCKNAKAIATFLSNHPAISKVHFPGLTSHRGHSIAKKQMKEFGAMLSFEVHGNKNLAMKFAGQTRVFKRATSLGGTESLIEHRASIEPPTTKTPESLLRLSIGLEHIEDLLDDLQFALRFISEQK